MFPVHQVTASYGYALWKSGPAVSPAEVESARESVVEVVVLWGTSVLHVAHVAPARGFFLGEATDRKSPCDFYVPTEALGAARAPLVVPQDDGAALVILPRSRGTLEVPGEAAVTFADLVKSGRARASASVPGAHEIDLAPDAKARVEIEGSRVTFEVSAVKAGKRVPAGLVTMDQPAGLASSALSLLLHLGIVSACAFFMPRIAGDEADDVDRDRILLMQRLLDAKAAEEQETKPTENPTSGSEASGGGASAAGAAGAMGTTRPTTHHGQYAIARTAEDPALQRERVLSETRTFSDVIGLLSSSSADPNAPVAPWGRNVASGNDAESVLGALFDTSIGESAGSGGLAISGPGEGGGGLSNGIGMTDFGGLGHGHGPGGPGGIGHGSGGVPGTYHPKQIGIHEGVAAVNGRLPREIIQRIVRQNFGRFRLCYEGGLRGNPGLEGRVEVKFVIDRSGAVSLAADGGSSLPNQDVVQCVVRSFRDLSFPPPEGGMVTVNYPIALSPSQ